MGRGGRTDSAIAYGPQLQQASPVRRSGRRSHQLKVLDDLVIEAADHNLGASKSATADSGNYVMAALHSDEDRRIAAEVQSSSIRVGYMLEDLANKIVDRNPDLTLFDEPLLGPGVDEKMAAEAEKKMKKSDREKAVVFSRLPKERVNALADSIKEKIVAAGKSGDNEHFSEEHLHDLISEAQGELASIPEDELDSEATPYIVDLAYQTPESEDSEATIFLTELKTSGNLDSKNAPDELRNVLKAVLALGPDHGRVLPAAGCYIESDRQSSLHQVFPPSLFWVNQDLWQRLLPDQLRPRDLYSSLEKQLPGYGSSAKNSSTSV